MLTYAFKILQQSNYDEIAAADFENIHDMFAAILGKGVAAQLKHGLYREYIDISDDLTTLRGKIDFPGTIKKKLQQKQVLTCEFDELSVNNLLNQIATARIKGKLSENWLIDEDEEENPKVVNTQTNQSWLFAEEA